MKNRESQPATENESEEDVQAHNLNMMGAPFTRAVSMESIGGNAGFYEIEGRAYPCAAINGYHDSESGKIITFGNFQQVSPDIRANNQTFTFKIALKMDGVKWEIHIIDVLFNSSPTQRAKEALEQTAAEWNKQNKK
jgi:hypothetical protein